MIPIFFQVYGFLRFFISDQETDVKEMAAVTSFSGFTGFGHQKADKWDEITDEDESKDEDDIKPSDPFLLAYSKVLQRRMNFAPRAPLVILTLLRRKD
mmetsp:Transcript_14120/g.21694  ORF Transcript_14120/g.21694 Transcript_14120/m.21694 type:complete len:98 (-) Transcript_14120:86-379(-)